MRLYLGKKKEGGWWSGSRCRPWVHTPVLKKKFRKARLLSRVGVLWDECFKIVIVVMNHEGAGLGGWWEVGQYWGWTQYSLARQAFYHLSHSGQPHRLVFLSPFFGETSVWTQGFMLAKQVLYSSRFALVILEMGVSWTVCPGWPQTTVLLISASQALLSFLRWRSCYVAHLVSQLSSDLPSSAS
jgi:hypothetical protein